MDAAHELLDPKCRHLACSAKLAALISNAWFEYSNQRIDCGSMLIVVPEGGQRTHDVYRCTAYFTVGGMTRVLDSWSTCTQMIRRGKVFISNDHVNDLEMSHLENESERTSSIS